MIGRSITTSESWKNIPWKKLRRVLFRLQCRVFKAVANKDMRSSRSLQKPDSKILLCKIIGNPPSNATERW